MKCIGGYVAAAAACAVLGLAAVAAGLLEHRIARAEEAMASLDFVESARAYDELEGSLWYAAYVPWIADDALTRIRARRAAVRYWDGDYDALLALARENAGSEAVDTELIFIAANAMYRMGQERAADPAALVRAMDDARAAYQTVLRQTDAHADAAFNYEYMMWMRDEIARATARRAAPGVAAQAGRPAVVPHTLHGREGGLPPGRTDEEFKVFVPQDRDEGSKGTTPGADQVRQRKG